MEEIFESKLIDNMSLVEIIQCGFIMLEEKDLNSLKLLSKHLIDKHSKCFWGYCFMSISETGINLTKPIQSVSYQLNNNDIQEDIKARIYYHARIKYFKAPTNKYEAICAFYPDVPGEKRNEWHRANTPYDKKLQRVLSLKKKYDFISTNYLHQMEIYSTSEKEVAIVHNFKLWGEYIEHALSGLNDYDKKAEAFVKEDFKKTPNPGNQKGFVVYTIFFALSLLLTLFSATRTIFSFSLPLERWADMIFSISSSVSLLGVSAMFISRSKLFNKIHPILVSSLILLVVIVAVLNIVSTFTTNELDIYVSSFIGLIGLIGGFFTAKKMRYYFPRNTYKCGSYIGNYKALCSNNFKVNFSYEWAHYLEGKEQEVGDISDYLTPYVE